MRQDTDKQGKGREEGKVPTIAVIAPGRAWCSQLCPRFISLMGAT